MLRLAPSLVMLGSLILFPHPPPFLLPNFCHATYPPHPHPSPVLLLGSMEKENLRTVPRDCLHAMAPFVPPKKRGKPKARDGHVGSFDLRGGPGGAFASVLRCGLGPLPCEVARGISTVSTSRGSSIDYFDL